MELKEQIDRLYAIYADRFQVRERASELVLKRYSQENSPRVPMLDRPEFEKWLLDDWRTPYFKRDWLSTFLELSDAGLQILPLEIQGFVADILAKLPTDLKIAS